MVRPDPAMAVPDIDISRRGALTGIDPAVLRKPDIPRERSGLPGLVNPWLPLDLTGLTQNPIADRSTPVLDPWLDFIEAADDPEPTAGVLLAVSPSFTIPFYSDGLRINPFEIDFRPSTIEETIARRARWLVSLCGALGPVPRKARLIRSFTDIFEAFPHTQTFRTLSALALEVETPEELETACLFRISWQMRPDWQLARHRGQIIACPAQLGWARALRWVRLCGGSDPADVLDSDWIEDWKKLPSQEKNARFLADHIETRLRLFSEGLWEQKIPDEFRHDLDMDVAPVTAEWLRSRTGLLFLDAGGAMPRPC